MIGTTWVIATLLTVAGLAGCATSGGLSDAETARISAEFKARQARCASLPETSRPPECTDLVKAQMEAERRREGVEDAARSVGSTILDTVIQGGANAVGGGGFWGWY
jgi:hypothetical protein